jgi:hypothetical protein
MARERDDPPSEIETALWEGVAKDASEHGPSGSSGHSQRSPVLPSL